MCTGPGTSVVATFTARSSVSSTWSASSRVVHLVSGRKRAWWSIPICVVRPSMESDISWVNASSGDRSSNAPPTPVLRLVAPGPNVP